MHSSSLGKNPQTIAVTIFINLMQITVPNLCKKCTLVRTVSKARKDIQIATLHKRGLGDQARFFDSPIYSVHFLQVGG